MFLLVEASSTKLHPAIIPLAASLGVIMLVFVLILALNVLIVRRRANRKVDSIYELSQLVSIFSLNQYFITKLN